MILNLLRMKFCLFCFVFPPSYCSVPARMKLFFGFGFPLVFSPPYSSVPVVHLITTVYIIIIISLLSEQKNMCAWDNWERLGSNCTFGMNKYTKIDCSSNKAKWNWYTLKHNILTLRVACTHARTYTCMCTHTHTHQTHTLGWMCNLTHVHRFPCMCPHKWNLSCTFGDSKGFVI